MKEKTNETNLIFFNFDLALVMDVLLFSYPPGHSNIKHFKCIFTLQQIYSLIVRKKTFDSV